VVILHPYAPATPLARTRRAWMAWSTLEDWCAARGWAVRHVRCVTPTDYEQAVCNIWGQADCCIAEHDIVPTPDALDQLATCPEPVCAQAYWLSAGAARRAGVHEALRLVATLDGTPSDDPRIRQLLTDARCWLEGVSAEGGAWAHRVVAPDGSWRFIATGEAWADAVGFGLTRWRVAAQRALTTWRPGSWQDLDSRISAAWHARGGRCHIHWPAVPHDHEED
jgi:hypothetical protein